MKSGDYSTACDKFEQSQRLAPAPGTLLNLAACNEKIGRLATALESLRAARDLLLPTDARHDYLKEQLAALEPRVPQLTIHLLERPQNVRVEIDNEGAPLELLGNPIHLDPGRHVVVVNAPDHEMATYTVTLAEGQTEKLAVRPGSLILDQSPPHRTRASAAIEPTETDDDRRSDARRSGHSTKRAAAYVALGAGGVGIVLGTITGIVVINKKSTMESHCDGAFACDDTGLDAASSGETFSTISTVTFLVGAAGLGVGAYLLLSDDSQDQSTAAIGFVPTANGADIVVQRRF